ncbi:MAG TPA: phosphotransferase family protein [Phenylobacterium sp.]|uniref:phosphotransferase family protein n=1 Tax=Phenylobacterium sp. TaxID=1871053 RepID=UPI002B45AE49|nr:phosphotransferase family protein [Phenylobacterium sp.]HKR89620.1 phosphotransferase family protein [Phenylobacterium sp.]
MSGLEEANSGVVSVRESLRFDETALAVWMCENVPDFRGPLGVEQFRGGQSNPTFKLTTPGRQYVLRRKPPGLLLKGAHAVEREAQVVAALHGAGFPVPRVFGLCNEPEVIGTAFYVMELVEGRIFWDARLERLAPAERSACYDSMNAAIAQLHTLDHHALRLADYGRPGNYFARQISRWSKQYLEDNEAGRDPGMDRLVEWLPNNIPPGDETTLVHGDYRIDNIIFHPTEPRVAAVLDWELSTLGHPLADFAYSAMSYRVPPTIVPGLGGQDPRELGLPTEAEYVAAYCRRTGRKEIPHFDFYIAFNFFRLAAIFHGIKGRVLRGTAASEQAHERVRALPQLLDLAVRQAQAAGMGFI